MQRSRFHRTSIRGAMQRFALSIVDMCNKLLSHATPLLSSWYFEHVHYIFIIFFSQLYTVQLVYWCVQWNINAFGEKLAGHDINYWFMSDERGASTNRQHVRAAPAFPLSVKTEDLRWDKNGCTTKYCKGIWFCVRCAIRLIRNNPLCSSSHTYIVVAWIVLRFDQKCMRPTCHLILLCVLFGEINGYYLCCAKMIAYSPSGFMIAHANWTTDSQPGWEFCHRLWCLRSGSNVPPVILHPQTHTNCTRRAARWMCNRKTQIPTNYSTIFSGLRRMRPEKTMQMRISMPAIILLLSSILSIDGNWEN